MDVRRGPADVEQHTRRNDANVGAVEYSALETKIHHFGSRPDSTRQIAPQFAHAFLVNEVVQVCPADSFKDAVCSAAKLVSDGVGHHSGLGKAAAKRVRKIPIAREEQRAVRVFPGIKLPQLLLQRRSLGAIDAAADQQDVNVTGIAGGLVEI